MKMMKKIILWLALSLAALLLLLLIINAFDEDLKPEISALAVVPATTVPEQENGYFDLFGFEAPAGQDVHKLGIEIVKEYEKGIEADPLGIVDSPRLKGLKSNRLKFSGDESKLCSSASSTCMAFYRDHSDDARRLVAENMLLLERYFQLYRYTHFQSTLKPCPAIPIPLYSPIRTAHRLLLAKIALQLKQGKTSTALAGLRQDSFFLRRMLEDSNTLISKLIAYALYNEDVRAISELISMKKFTPAEEATARTILSPLSPSERSLGRVIRYEGEIYGNGLIAAARGRLYTFFESAAAYESGSALSKIKWFFLRSFFKVNATLNLLSRGFTDTLSLDALSAKDYAAQMNDGPLIQAERKRLELRWDMVYNPAGKMLYAVWSPSSSAYINRGHKLDALMKLVSLQLLLKEKSVPKDRVEQFIANAGQEYADPYTGGPMQWDAGKGSIYFNAVVGSGELKDRVEIRL